MGNEIKVHVSREIGELRVLHSKTNEPIEKAYCKVYAQNIRDDSIAFYKDGYTDVRGRFDYRFLSTDQLRSSKRLSVLVSTESHGSVIKEITVPMSMLTTTNLFTEKFTSEFAELSPKCSNTSCAFIFSLYIVIFCP